MSTARDVPGSEHGHETIAYTRVRRWPRLMMWRASCDCGWVSDHPLAGDAGRALAAHPHWDILLRPQRRCR